MNLMNWNECKKKHVRKVSVDEFQIKSLKNKAIKRLKRARNSKDIDFVVEDYYEVIKELLVCLMLSHGLRSKNHQCLISFFYKITKNEADSLLISQMSYFRNRLVYYGENIPKTFLDRNQFEKIIKNLLEK